MTSLLDFKININIAFNYFKRSGYLLPESYEFYAKKKKKKLFFLFTIAGGGFASWRSLAQALGDRIFTELESSQSQVDTLSDELLKECENGRLVRLMLKLNMVLERPELMGDSRWAETADRYLLALFRDFVFHLQEFQLLFQVNHIFSM